MRAVLDFDGAVDPDSLVDRKLNNCLTPDFFLCAATHSALLRKTAYACQRTEKAGLLAHHLPGRIVGYPQRQLPVYPRFDFGS